MMIVTIEVFACLILAMVSAWAVCKLFLLLLQSAAKTYFRTRAMLSPRAICSDCGRMMNVPKIEGGRQICDACFNIYLAKKITEKDVPDGKPH